MRPREMMKLQVRHGWLHRMVLSAMVVILTACGSTRVANRAPVEDRGVAQAKAVSNEAVAVAGTATEAPPLKPPLPGAENAGKPGYYTIKPGDTLIRIGLENGQSWRDIVRWNRLDNPNRIEIGQVLRITPPGAVPAAEGEVVARPVVTPNAPQPVPLAAPTASQPVASAASAAGTSSAGLPKPVAPSTAVPASPPAAGSAEEDIAWVWPTSGQVMAGFDEAKNKGLDLAGNAGDPVFASAEGRVVYSGSGLRGYGNLIILKHNNTFLTAYAHNQTLLVKEDQTVRKGQKIAEMGSSDTDRVKLHFEIRRQGKPVDPARYLPAR
jgi:lipoprotein NlpD